MKEQSSSLSSASAITKSSIMCNLLKRSARDSSAESALVIVGRRGGRGSWGESVPLFDNAESMRALVKVKGRVSAAVFGAWDGVADFMVTVAGMFGFCECKLKTLCLVAIVSPSCDCCYWKRSLCCTRFDVDRSC
jgi:hypothetical protein